jgi:hypothetical protein
MGCMRILALHFLLFATVLTRRTEGASIQTHGDLY